MSASHFRELNNVWQDAMELAKRVYQLTSTFPREERYGLCSQMQRAAVSIPSNIAEGNARSSRKDYARLVSLAAGSAAELQTQLLLSQELEMADREPVAGCLALCERVSKMLYRLQQSLMHPDGARAQPVPGPRSPVPDREFRSTAPRPRRS
jgi:carbamoyl-phosphate synthase large subunit